MWVLQTQLRSEALPPKPLQLLEIHPPDILWGGGCQLHNLKHHPNISICENGQFLR